MTGSNQYRLDRTDYEIAKEELNHFYQFKDLSLYQEYLLYHFNTKPFSAVFFLLMINTLVFLPATILSLSLYVKIESPDKGYILVGVFLVLSCLFSSLIGFIYVAERIFPKWKIYKKSLLLFRRCRRRYAKVYTTGLSLTRERSALSFTSETIRDCSDRTLANRVEHDDEDEVEEDDMHTPGVSVCYTGRNSYQEKKGEENMYGAMSKKIIIFQQIFLFLVMMVNILFFVHSGIQRNCHDYGSGPMNALFRRCGNLEPVGNDGPKLDVYPILFMFTPVLVSCIFRELLFELQIANHFIVVILAVIATAVNSHSKLTMGLLCGWMFGGYFVLLDLHTHNVAAFLTSYKIREILLEKERNADQAAATEMRHMIGNVAHDLKTPLASFTTGLEIIADIIETNEKALELLTRQDRTSNLHTEASFASKDSSPLITRIGNASHHHSASSNRFSPSQPSNNGKLLSRSFNSSTKASVHGLLENNQGIKHCLQNIRDTNTFMLMTINRCIDYTKASRGFKLVPKYETLDLQETLRLPLDCMKNIQERIRIALKPIDMKEICSHIITDKQWLQENILCLLSNAVKYSTGGEVTIAVYLTKIEKSKVQHAPSRLTESNVSTKTEGDRQKPPTDLKVNKASVTPTSSLTHPLRWREQISLALYNVINGSSKRNSSHSQVSGNGSKNLDPEVGIKPQENDVNRDMRSFRETSSGKKQEVDLTPAFERSNTTIPTHYIRFDVEDTGIGMSSEAMGQLFSPFRQAQRLAGGTGLGLYSLAKRVEAQNGSYGVMKRSDGKQGSLFWFAIPYRPDYTTADMMSSFVRGPEEEKRWNDAPDKVAPTPPRDQSPLIRRNSLEFGITDMKLPQLHILLVDDSASIVKMSSMMLKRQGHVIEIADNGENALQCIQNRWTSTQRGFDIILMDLQMPVMDGLEATRRLRSLEAECPSWLRPHSFEEDSESSSTANKLGQVYEAWSRTYPSHSYHHAVIGVSANSDDETAREAIEAGVDAFLPKPFSMDLFNSTAMKVLSKIYDSYED